MKSRLILGDGLLGTELVKQTGWDYISRKKDGIDFKDIKTYQPQNSIIYNNDLMKKIENSITKTD